VTDVDPLKVTFNSAVPHVAQGLFGLSSLLTPFFMGTVVGAITAGRVRSATPRAIR
jgi:hypothetical protein